jgi:hypothetical protein
MTTDRIVDEVRAARAALLQAAGGTLDGLLDFLTRQEAAAGRAPVSLPPKRPGDHEVPRVGQASS